MSCWGVTPLDLLILVSKENWKKLENSKNSWTIKTGSQQDLMVHLIIFSVFDFFLLQLTALLNSILQLILQLPRLLIRGLTMLILLLGKLLDFP